MYNFIRVGLTVLLILTFENCTGFKASQQSLSSLDGRFTDAVSNPSLACPTADPGQTVLRRLNKDELANSLKDILGISAVDVSAVPSDSTSTDGFINNASFLTLDSNYIYEVVNVVEAAVAAAATSNTGIFNCTAGNNSACVRSLLASLGRKAYRRSLTSTELDGLSQLVFAQQSSGVAFGDAVGLGYQRIFLSPLFLFRTSFGSAGRTSGIAILTAQEYVTRLAYFLWNSPPDDRLLSLADQDKLNTVDAVKAEVTRMLQDPKALRFNESFTGQWIGTRGLVNTVATHTGLTLQQQLDMKTETDTFTASIIQSNASPMDFIAGDYTFINEGLAGIYGISGVTGTQFRKVSLAGTPRRGVLTQGAFLTLNSADDHSKPTARGNKILQNITCTPPPPFPPGQQVTQLVPDPTGMLTIKQQLAAHSTNVACAGCHVNMDQVGLGFENFDQIGQFRTVYSNGLAVDPSGTMYGQNFSNSADLLNLIKQQDSFKQCITKKLMTYAIGRSLNDSDQCVVSKIGQAAVQPDKTFLDLVVAIVLSEPFRMNNTNSAGE